MWKKDNLKNHWAKTSIRKRTIQNLKLARARQIITNEHKKNIGLGLKKAYHEGRRKVSLNIGKWNIGRRHTKEWNKNNSEAKKGSIPWNIGRVENRKDVLRKSSESHKRYYMENPSSREKIKERRRAMILPVKDTSIEVKIQNYLKEIGITFFTHQYIKDIEHGYQCDILIPSMNLVIECDGNYWHKYPIGREIDNVRTKELLDKGFKVLRLWEVEIKKMNLEEFENKLNYCNRINLVD